MPSPRALTQGGQRLLLETWYLVSERHLSSSFMMQISCSSKYDLEWSIHSMFLCSDPLTVFLLVQDVISTVTISQFCASKFSCSKLAGDQYRNSWSAQPALMRLKGIAKRAGMSARWSTYKEFSMGYGMKIEGSKLHEGSWAVRKRSSGQLIHNLVFTSWPIGKRVFS